MGRQNYIAMPVGKENNKSKDGFWSVTRSSTILLVTKPDEHKGAIRVVRIEAVMLFYARHNNTFSSFLLKQNLPVSSLAQ